MTKNMKKNEVKNMRNIFKNKFNNLSFIISFSLSILLIIILISSLLIISLIISYQSKIYDRRNKEVIVNLIQREIEKRVPSLIDNFKIKKFMDFIKEISEKYGVIINIKKTKHLMRFEDENCDVKSFINPDKDKLINLEPMMQFRELPPPGPMGANIRGRIPDAVVILTYKNINYYFLIWFIKISRGYYLSKIRNGIIFVFIIGFVISTIISILFSKKISNFIKKLSLKMEEIANGNFGQIIEENPIKEINDLNLAFNKMSLRLKEFSEERKRITSNISHEIRTPLTILKSYMEGFKDNVLKPDENTIKDILEEIQRLEEMVENLKILTEIEQKNEFNKIEKINVREILDDIIKKNRLIFKKENVKIVKEIENITIKFDEQDFRSLVTNIIKNGIKYNNKDKKVIEIKIKKDKKNKIMLSIKDNGIGIEDKYKDLVFERFYRIDTSRSSKTGGRGLGLAIVKEIVSKYKGEIKINSEKDKFTEFIIKFNNIIE